MSMATKMQMLRKRDISGKRWRFCSRVACAIFAFLTMAFLVTGVQGDCNLR